MWFNNSWQYRKRIIIRNNNPYFIPYGHVYLEFSYSDISTFVKSDLSDIVFVDHDKVYENGMYKAQSNQLYHFFNYIDTTNKKAGVFIKVPNIPANGNKVIFMYFGNSNATVTSYRSAANTFDYYLDLSTIPNTSTLDNYLEIVDIRNNNIVTFTNNTLSPFVTFNTSSKTVDISNAVDVAVRIKGLKIGRLQRIYALAKPSTNKGTLFGLSWFDDNLYYASESVLQSSSNLKLKHIANRIEADPLTVTYAPNTSVYNYVKLSLTSNKVTGSVAVTSSLSDFQSVSIQSIVNRTEMNVGLYNYGLDVSTPSSTYTPNNKINDLSYGSSYGIAVGNNGYCLKFSSNSYSVVNTGRTENLNSVLVDGTTVLIAGENGLLLRSTDSGSTFSVINTGISYGLNKIKKIGSNYFIVGNQGTILKLNSSFSLTIYSTTGNSNIDLYDIDGDGSNKIIAVGTNGNIIFTDNNGDVWSSKNIWTDNLTSISYIGNNKFIIGTYKEVLVSENNGASFREVSTGRFDGYITKLYKLPSSNITYGSTDKGYVIYIYDNNLVPYEVKVCDIIPKTAFSIISAGQIWYYDNNQIQIRTLYSCTASYSKIIITTAFDKELEISLSQSIENSSFPINSLKLLQSAYLQEPSKKYIGTALLDTNDGNKLKLWDGDEWIYTGLKILTPTEYGFLSNWASGETITPGQKRVIEFTGNYDIDLRGVRLDQTASTTNPAIYHLRWLVYSITPPPPVPISGISASFPDISRTISYVVDNNSPETMIPSYQFSFTVNLPNSDVNVLVTDPNTLDVTVNRTNSDNSSRVTITVRPRVRPGISGIRQSSLIITVSAYSFEPVQYRINFNVEYVNFDAGSERYDIDNNNYRITAVRRVRPVIVENRIVVVQQVVVVQLPIRCRCIWWRRSGVCSTCFDYAIEITPTLTSGSFDIDKVGYYIARSTDSGDFLTQPLSDTFRPKTGIPIVVNEGYQDSPFTVIDILLYYFGNTRQPVFTYTGTNDGGIGYGFSIYNAAVGIQDLGFAKFIASDRRFFRQSGYVIVSRIS
ncbi:MAG: DUF2341 domain-containing protein [Nitrososphaerota archaeon]